MLKTSVHSTDVRDFMIAVLLKLVCPGYYLKFKPHRHGRVNLNNVMILVFETVTDNSYWAENRLVL